MGDYFISVNLKLLQAVFENAKILHPKETVLLLRGKSKGDMLQISEILIPPLATHGTGFAIIPIHMLPMDFSIMGTAHSHPSGSLTPSIMDLNHFFGKILLIVAPPYRDEGDAAVYNRRGEKLIMQLSET